MLVIVLVLDGGASRRDGLIPFGYSRGSSHDRKSLGTVHSVPTLRNRYFSVPGTKLPGLRRAQSSRYRHLVPAGTPHLDPLTSYFRTGNLKELPQTYDCACRSFRKFDRLPAPRISWCFFIPDLA